MIFTDGVFGETSSRSTNIELSGAPLELEIETVIIIIIIINCNLRTKRISGNNTRKAFNRFSTKDNRSRNIAHNKESATI
jgi:hypothetical protein